MKIAYLAFLDIGYESGVLKKIKSQISTWIGYGNSVKFFVLTPNSVIWSGLRNISVDIFTYESFFSRFFKFKELVDTIMKWKPDILYIRFGVYYPPVRKLMKQFPTILEINTDYNMENKIILSKYRRFYHKFSNEIFIRNSAGMVFVTNELANKFEKYKKPYKVISNGMDLSEYTVLPPSRNIEGSFIFLGSPGFSWHGVDKIFIIAKKLPKYRFNLIGYSYPDFNKKVPENIECYGILGRNEYEKIIASSDIAIGTLALHRKGMNEASPLKVREYLAYGIPTIIGYHDIDFLKNSPFLLELPNESDNVINNIEKIKKFINIWKGRRVDRKYITHINVKYKEKERIKFFNYVKNINTLN